VEPAPLATRAGEDFVERLPEAERAVADRRFRRGGEPAGLEVDQERAPASRARSRTPTCKPIGSFSPSGVAPTIAGMGSAVGSMRACR
jgi:hypothetical protein